MAGTSSSHNALNRASGELCYCVNFRTALPTQPLHFPCSSQSHRANSRPQFPHTLCRLESCWCLMSTSLLGNCLLHSRQASLFQSVSLSSLTLAFRGCSSRGAGGCGGGGSHWAWDCSSSSSSSSLSLSPPYSPKSPIRGFTTLG